MNSSSDIGSKTQTATTPNSRRYENAELQQLHELYVAHVRDWLRFERALRHSKVYRESFVPGSELGSSRKDLDDIYALVNTTWVAHARSTRAYAEAFEACSKDTLTDLRTLDVLDYLDDLLGVFPDLTYDEAAGWLRRLDTRDLRAVLEQAFAQGRYGLRKGNIIFRTPVVDNT